MPAQPACGVTHGIQSEEMLQSPSLQECATRASFHNLRQEKPRRQTTTVRLRSVTGTRYLVQPSAPITAHLVQLIGTPINRLKICLFFRV